MFFLRKGRREKLFGNFYTLSQFALKKMLKYSKKYSWNLNNKRILSKLYSQIKDVRLQVMLQYFFHDEFLPQNNFLRFFAKYGCDQNIVENEICADMIFMICGYDREQFNYVSIMIRDRNDTTPIESSIITSFHDRAITLQIELCIYMSLFPI